MREYLNTSDIANTIMMLKTAFKGTIVVVEGITDRRLYGKFFDNDNVEVVIAHSKDNVRNSVRTVYGERKYDSVIGIMDADLDHLFRKKRLPPIFITDTRDNETLMLKTNAFDDILSEYGDKDLIDRFVDSFGDIREVVLNSCYPLGLLMYVSEREGLGLGFRDLNFNYFIDKKTLRCNIWKMIDEVINNTNARGINAKRVYALLEKELQIERDPWDVCRGHDAMEVFTIGLRSIFGGNNSKYIQDSELAGGFRLAFDFENMASTKLYADTTTWCKKKGLALWSISR